MNKDQTSTTLTPNLRRAFVRVFLPTLLVITVAAVSEMYGSGRWWSIDYFASFVIPLFLMPTFVCLVFVPRRLRWSAVEFEIQPRFGRVQILAWTQLYAYGIGNNVFLLQFDGVTTFQIFSGAFGRDEWQAFRTFLTTVFPGRKASLWLGPKAIRWNRGA